jgi:hypothetical protein
VLKKIAVVTSVVACSFIPVKAFATPSPKAILLSHLSEEIVFFTPTQLLKDNESFLFIERNSARDTTKIQLSDPIFGNLSHDIYGIMKSIWRKLGIDSEVDDDSEGTFREYGVFFVLFGGLFVWMIFKSLSDVNRK